MEFALDKNNTLVNADYADYGIYYCPECNKPCGLKKPFLKKYHFFHIRIDKNCSLCVKDEQNSSSSILQQFILDECNNAFEIIIKNTTEEKWFEAIDCLFKYNQLKRLSGCNFALKPLALYLEKIQISYEDISKHCSVENFFIETALSIIENEVDLHNSIEKIINKYNFNNKHLNILIQLYFDRDIELLGIPKLNVGNNNKIYTLFKSIVWKLKKEIKVADFQKLNQIELSFIDYLIVYQFIQRNYSFSTNDWLEFKKIVLKNNDYLDLGQIKFNEFIRNEI